MDNLTMYVPPLVLEHLSESEAIYLDEVFSRFAGYPRLENLWQLLDEQWISNECDPLNLDDRVTAFYEHPVWVLNGLFAETDRQSLINRRIFTDWVLNKKPARVADFGGGFGGLARMIGEALPETEVEVVDPHPHPAAIALAARTPNVRFVPNLTNEYDILIATDVFEHVVDPVSLTAETAQHLRRNASYLIANCFAPVILCHLPQLLHFSISWNSVMTAMNLEPGEIVGYGRAYSRLDRIDLASAYRVADCSKKLYPLVSWMPIGKSLAGRLLMKFVRSGRSP